MSTLNYFAIGVLVVCLCKIATIRGCCGVLSRPFYIACGRTSCITGSLPNLSTHFLLRACPSRHVRLV